MSIRSFPFRIVILAAAIALLAGIALIRPPESPLAILGETERIAAESLAIALGVEIESVRPIRSPGGEWIDLHPMIDGIPVLGERLRLERDAVGKWRPTSTPSLPRPGTSIRVRAVQPIATAAALVDTSDGLRGRVGAQASWFRLGAGWINGTVVRLPLRNYRGESLPWTGVRPQEGRPVDLELRFDAWGSLVEARDLLLHLGSIGNGMVFDPNPVTTSGDRSLRNGDPVDRYRTAVELRRLDGTGRLSGAHVRVETGANLSAQEPGLSYFYPSDDPRFEEVMAYYHIDRTRAWLDSLGYGMFFEKAQRVTVHASPLDNSWYSPLTGRIEYGDGGVDDAEDADIILHEFGHAIHDAFVPGFGDGDTRAISEGFADYLAATRSNDPCVGDWDATSYSPPCLRAVDLDLRFPDDLEGSPHHDGQIWSGALWEIRNLLGGADADLLVLEGLLRTGPSTGFREAAEELLRAANGLSMTDSVAEIRAILIDRGFLERSGSVALLPDEKLAVRLDTAWPAEPIADSLHFDGRGGCAIGTQLILRPLEATVPIGIEIDYAADLEGFVWEWRLVAIDGAARGRVRLDQSGALEITWSGDPRSWPTGRFGIALGETEPAPAERQVLLTEKWLPPTFEITVGSGERSLSGGRVTLRREGNGWRIVTYLEPRAIDKPLLIALSNPARAVHPLRLDLPSATTLDLAIFDVAGRRVRRILRSEMLPAGPHRIDWDGRDDSGRLVPSGSYWARVHGGGFNETTPILRLGP